MAERQRIDARGALCPGPLMELITALKKTHVGDEVEVLSSDRGSISDIPKWVGLVGHALVAATPHDGYWSIVVRKAK